MCHTQLCEQHSTCKRLQSAVCLTNPISPAAPHVCTLCHQVCSCGAWWRSMSCSCCRGLLLWAAGLPVCRAPCSDYTLRSARLNWKSWKRVGVRGTKKMQGEGQSVRAHRCACVWLLVSSHLKGPSSRAWIHKMLMSLSVVKDSTSIRLYHFPHKKPTGDTFKMHHGMGPSAMSVRGLRRLWRSCDAAVVSM